MYTIGQASLRSGVSVALLRAWERRYHLLQPERTAAGYRLYDDAAIERLRLMRRLVDAGWAPSQAAHAIVGGTVPTDALPPVAVPAPSGAPSPATGRLGGTSRHGMVGSPSPAGSAAPPLPLLAPAADLDADRLVERFVDAAARLDDATLEATLDLAFGRGTFEAAAREVVLPAMVAVGDAWARGRLDVVGEHAATEVVLRRLGALYEAAGRPSGRPDVLVGLPPGSRHELGALAFAVVARRSGLEVQYLGPDVPVTSWVAATREGGPTAAVIAVVTSRDVEPAREALEALHAARPEMILAVGGRSAERLPDPRWVVRLPADLESAVEALGAALRRGPQPGA